jgi:TPR repeat protein
MRDMRYLSAITMLILTLAITHPVAAQSFKPDYWAAIAAWQTQDFATVLKHLRPLAEQGHAGAAQNLGRMYQDGLGVNKDMKQAVKWYRIGAKLGDSYGLLKLGWSYRDGKDVLQDLVMAYVWFNIAAIHGNEEAIKERNEVRAKLTASELKLARKLSKLCLRKPAKCPEYSDD